MSGCSRDFVLILIVNILIKRAWCMETTIAIISAKIIQRKILDDILNHIQVSISKGENIYFPFCLYQIDQQ